jgi:hypothetical protein
VRTRRTVSHALPGFAPTRSFRERGQVEISAGVRSRSFIFTDALETGAG